MWCCWGVFGWLGWVCRFLVGWLRVFSSLGNKSLHTNQNWPAAQSCLSPRGSSLLALFLSCLLSSPHNLSASWQLADLTPLLLSWSYLLHSAGGVQKQMQVAEIKRTSEEVTKCNVVSNGQADRGYDGSPSLTTTTVTWSAKFWMPGRSAQWKTEAAKFDMPANLLQYGEHRRGSSSVGFRRNQDFKLLSSSQDVWQTIFHLAFSPSDRQRWSFRELSACKPPA